MEFEKGKFMQFTRDMYVGHGVINKAPDVVRKNLLRGNLQDWEDAKTP